MWGIIWTDAAVQAAAIQAAGTLLAAGVAALCAAIVGQQVAGRKRLQEKLEEAHSDIDFLLAVEAEHCNKHRENGSSSNKMRVRNRVRETGFIWSGRHTPGRR